MEKQWTKHYDPGVPPSLEYPPKRVFDFLDESAARWPYRAALIFQDWQLSYADLAQLVDLLARGLIAWGVKKGDRVSLVLPNCPQFVLAYYAVLKAGGIVSAVNPNYTARELEFQIRQAGSTFVIGEEKARPVVKEMQERLNLLGCAWTRLGDASEMSTWLSSEPSSCLTERTELQNLVMEGRKFFGLFPAVSPDDPAVFQFSGGTTGTPKAAVGLHRNLVANTIQFRHWLSGFKDGEETALLVIPLYHVYGMVVGMSVAVLLGARMVLAPDPRDLLSLLKWIEDYRVSFLPGVPTLYAHLNRHPDVQAGRFDLKSIRACISGSAPLPESTRLEFERLSGAKLMEGYGLSEAPTATHCNPMLGEKRTGSMGLPLPDVDCRIVDVDHPEKDLSPGQAGELILRGPQVMHGYYQMPEETAATIRDGWLHTGDIARMDEDGYFYILDRQKDLIKVSGFQVWPREVEETLADHPAVLEAAAIGVPDPVRGESVKAYVVLKPGRDVSDDDLRSWCKQSLVYYKVPAHFEFCDALPRSEVGKLLRRELRGGYA